MCQDLPDRPRIGDERDESDVTTTLWALQRKLLPHQGHEFGPGDPRGVARAGLLIRVVAADGAATVVPTSAGRDLALLADIPDGQRRDGPPERVIRREYSVIPVPVFLWRRHEGHEPVEELIRREFDDAVGAGPRSLSAAARADTVPLRAGSPSGSPPSDAARHHLCLDGNQS